jgi:hypothetical protein
MHTDIEAQALAVESEGIGRRLRELPDEMLPPCNWQEFQSRSQQRSLANGRRPMVKRAAVVLGSTAIAVTVVAALIILVSGTSIRGQIDKSAGGSTGIDDARITVDDLAMDGWHHAVSRDTRVGAGREPSIDVVRDESQRTASSARNVDARSEAIESWLASLPREPAVVHVGTRAAVAGLEDRIAQVDDLLTSVRLEGARPDGLAVLQQERTRLVGSLAQVRYAEVVAAESP